MSIFNDLSSFATNENGKKEIKYLILEQKYLELLEKGNCKVISYYYNYPK